MEELESKTGTWTSQERICSNSLYESSKICHPSTSPPDYLVKSGTNDFTSHVTGPGCDPASYRDESQPKEGTPGYDTADHRDGHHQPLLLKETAPQQNYAQLRQPSKASITPQPVPPTPLEATFTDEIEQPVYDEANLPPPTTSAPEKKVTSKSRAAYEEINNDFLGGDISSGGCDKTNSTPSPKDKPSANIYSELQGAANVYSAIEEHSSVYSVVKERANTTNSALEGPTEGYSKLSHPAKAIAKPERVKLVSNYSKLTAEDVSPYDVTNHGHPQTQPQTLPPHEAALYDTANYPNEPTAQHDYDYAETAVKPHPYEYVHTYLDSKGVASSVPPAVDPQVRPVYINTLPGKITAEAESHYDLGQ